MKPDWSQLEPFRLMSGPLASLRGSTFGMFIFNKGFAQIRAMACDAEETGWEHVSVSVMIRSGKNGATRMPTWEEMCWAKDQFWNEDEAVIQFHPPTSEYVNNHPHCLHLWRCVSMPFPLPPSILVGVKQLGPVF